MLKRHTWSFLCSALAAIALFRIDAAHAQITATSDPNALAAALAQNAGDVTGAAFTALPPGGTPHGTATGPLAGFPTDGGTFTILTSGDVNFADDPNNSNSTGVSDGGGAVRGNTDRDVSVLRIDLDVPVGVNCLSINFRFLSDEYPEYVGTQYNDAFIAELDSSTWTTSGSTISAPNNFAFDPSNNVISINAAGAASMSAAEAAGTTYDGATPLLTASTPITSGAHSLYLSIFDQGDQVFDSAVFLDRLVLGTTTPGGCQAGATVLSTTKTADAATAGVNAVDGYTITVSNPSGSAVTLATITDSLPAGFAYVPGSTTGATTSDPGIVGQDLTWTGPFTLPASGSVSLHFSVTVAGTPGTYFNNAGATSDDAAVTPTGPTAPITVQGCGDNAVNQPGEQCDGTADDACPGECQVDCTCAVSAQCGDNSVNQANEQCDGTDDTACPGQCLANCKCPVCGDNSVNQTSEQCDGADDSACPGRCSADCTCAPLPVCGDNAVNAAGEQCDGTDDTACPGACGAPTAPNACRCPTCGDGIVNQQGEACDGTDATQCPGTCQPDCTCPGVCGDNVVNQPAEECDGTSDVACPGRCIAPAQTGQCTCSLCGNGVLDPGETCDDGNTVQGCRQDKPQRPLDACRNNCTRQECQDPSRIQFRAGLDRLYVHGRLTSSAPDGSLDPNGKSVSLRLTSPEVQLGLVFSAALRSGVTGVNGRYTYRNRDAARTGGIEFLKIRKRSFDSYAVTLQARGDLSLATKQMTTHLMIGDEEWTIDLDWQRAGSGWRAGH